MCLGKKRRSSNYCIPEILEDHQKKPRHSKQKKKNYQRNVIKIQVDAMNVRIMKSRRTACLHHLSYIVENIQYTKDRKRLIFDTCEMIMYVPNVYQQTQIQTTNLTISNVQPNIQRYVFVFVNIVHMEVDDAFVSQKHYLC